MDPRPVDFPARYALESELGRGGMGIVFRARDGETGEAVALKAARSGDDEDEAALAREVRALVALRSRFAVRVIDVDRSAGGRLFFAMEALGDSLSALIARGDRRRAERVLASVLEALAAVHGQGLIHGDLKPTNIFATGDDEARLIDFGTARRRRRDLARPAGEGTPRYAAPEQIRGSALDARADLYAFGVVACEVLTGSLPFATLADKLAGRIAPGIAVPAAILPLLERDPRDRPRSALALRASWDANVDEDRPRAHEPRVVSPALAGRANEVAALRRFATRIASGASGAVVISGESGSGKSRILRDPEWRAELIVSRRIRAVWTPPGGRAEQSAGWQVARAAVEATPKSEALLIIADDADRISAAGRARIAAMLRSRAGAPSGLILGARCDADSLAAIAGDKSDPERIELGPLSRADAAELIEASLAPPVPVTDDLITRLELRSGSQPGALIGAIGRAVANGALELDTAWSIVAPAPIDPAQLDSDDRRILIAAEALRSPASIAELASVAGVRGDLATRAVERAVDAGLLERDGETDGEARFAVAVRLGPLADSIGIDEAECAAILRRAAEHSIARGALRARQAAGLLARAGETERARALFVDDARRATASSDHRRAAASLLAACDLSDQTERRSILPALIDSRLAVRDSRGALEAIAAARASNIAGDSAMLEREARAHLYAGDARRARDLLARSLELASGESHEARARRSLAAALTELGELDAARSHWEWCLEHESSLDAEARIAVHAGIAMIAKARGDIDDAVRRYESARSIAIDVNDAPRTAQILNNLGNLLRQRGDLDAALGAFEESLEARRAMRDRLGVAACFNNLATTETVRGDFEEALALASTAFALFEELGDLRGVLIASLNLAELEIEIGSYEHAREHIERSSELARTSGSKPLEATALAHRARLAERQGDLASAESHARAMLASFGESAPKPLRTRALATLLDVCSRTDRSEEADSARDEAHALIETALDSAAALEFAIASAMHTARIGDLAAARDELELSLAALAAAPRVLRARASCALGTIYRDLGPDWADRVERHFEHAIKEFADMGALRDLALARTEYSHYWSLLGEDEAAASLLEPLET